MIRKDALVGLKGQLIARRDTVRKTSKPIGRHTGGERHLIEASLGSTENGCTTNLQRGDRHGQAHASQGTAEAGTVRG